MALASILIQSIPGQWENPVRELVQTFQGTVLLFEILTVIPEEFSTQVSKKTKSRNHGFVLLIENQRFIYSGNAV